MSIMCDAIEPLFATVVLCTEDNTEAATFRVPLQSDTTIRQLAKESMRRLVLSRRKHDPAWASTRLCVTGVTVTGGPQPSAEVFSEDVVASVVCARTEVVRMRFRVKPSTTSANSSQPVLTVATSGVSTPSMQPAAELSTPMTVAAYRPHHSTTTGQDDTFVKTEICGNYKRVRQPPLPSTPPTVPACRLGRRRGGARVKATRGTRKARSAAATATSASASAATVSCATEMSNSSSNSGGGVGGSVACSEVSATARRLLYEESDVEGEGGVSARGQLCHGAVHDRATQDEVAVTQALTPCKTTDAPAHTSTPRHAGWGSEAARYFDLHTYCDDPRKAKLTPEELRQPVRAHRNVVLPPYFALLDVI